MGKLWLQGVHEFEIGSRPGEAFEKNSGEGEGGRGGRGTKACPQHPSGMGNTFKHLNASFAIPIPIPIPTPNPIPQPPTSNPHPQPHSHSNPQPHSPTPNLQPPSSTPFPSQPPTPFPNPQPPTPILNPIPPGAFASCKSLLSIDLPDSLLRIDRDAFRGCDSLAPSWAEGWESPGLPKEGLE